MITRNPNTLGHDATVRSIRMAPLEVAIPEPGASPIPAGETKAPVAPVMPTEVSPESPLKPSAGTETEAPVGRFWANGVLVAVDGEGVKISREANRPSDTEKLNITQAVKVGGDGGVMVTITPISALSAPETAQENTNVEGAAQTSTTEELNKTESEVENV